MGSSFNTSTIDSAKRKSKKANAIECRIDIETHANIIKDYVNLR